MSDKPRMVTVPGPGPGDRGASAGFGLVALIALVSALWTLPAEADVDMPMTIELLAVFGLWVLSAVSIACIARAILPNSRTIRDRRKPTEARPQGER